MTNEEKVQSVKDLLNTVVLVAGDSTDDFLSKAKTQAEELLKDQDSSDDYQDSEDYYDSSCY